MDFKKHLTKGNIKRFFTGLTLNFVFISLIMWLMILIFSDGSPKPIGVWLLLILTYSIMDSIKHVMNFNRVQNISELTSGNYWKLKKELRTKMNKKR